MQEKEMQVKGSKYTHRFLARFVVEAKTPLAIGSGEKDIISDALVTLDFNQLPYIPGTALLGVVRSMLDLNKEQRIFGYQKGKTSFGSEIIFTEGKILNSRGEVTDGYSEALTQDPLLKYYAELPVRQHVSINHQGVAKNTGKFDEQVVFAGSRFCFEFEILSDGENQTDFERVISAISQDTFSVGSGTRSGFGKIQVVPEYTRYAILDLTQKEDLEKYLRKSSNLQESSKWEGWVEEKDMNIQEQPILSEPYIEYRLTLTPEDFFSFGSGYGTENGDADDAPVRAKRVDWTNGYGELKENCVLIPATSLKGALSHRIAYHYNLKTHCFAETVNKDEGVGCNNKAVVALFGKQDTQKKDLQRGNVLFSDIIKSAEVSPKLITHVSIDRFTGGAIDSALFTELVDYAAGEKFETKLLVRQSALEDADVKHAFHAALDDLTQGRLPLGGSVNRGHGLFTGTWKN